MIPKAYWIWFTLCRMYVAMFAIVATLRLTSISCCRIRDALTDLVEASKDGDGSSPIGGVAILGQRTHERKECTERTRIISLHFSYLLRQMKVGITQLHSTDKGEE